jgi:hypothetical protein
MNYSMGKSTNFKSKFQLAKSTHVSKNTDWLSLTKKSEIQNLKPFKCWHDVHLTSGDGSKHRCTKKIV